MTQPINLDYVTLDRDNPWPGLAAFTEAQRDFFFGRSGESAELARRARARMLTILFGQSGLGKTSLLRAGLFPRLREQDAIPILVRLNHVPGALPLADQVRQAIGEAVKARQIDAPLLTTESGQTLWEYFHRRGLEFWTPRNRPATLVLVFDQFEEIYTLGRLGEQTRERGEQFLVELADLVENRPPAKLQKRLAEATEGADDQDPPFDFDAAPCRVLLSLREDYLPDLEGLRARAPSINENRMRLQPLNGRQALEVLCQGGRELIEQSTAARVVRFVAGAGSVEASTEADVQSLEGLDIEPALLSIFAHELNRKRQALGLGRITPDLLAGHRDQIINDFYERSVGDLPPAVRVFIEDSLLTPSGFRDSLAMEVATGPEGTSRTIIDQLVGRRLLHIDQRLGTQRLELTHDVLTGPIRASRDARMQRQAVQIAQHREKEARAQLGKARRQLVLALAMGLFFLGLMLMSILLWRQASDAKYDSQRQTRRAEEKKAEAEKNALHLAAWIHETLVKQELKDSAIFASAVKQSKDAEGLKRGLERLREDYQKNSESTHELRATLWLAQFDGQPFQPWFTKHRSQVLEELWQAMAAAKVDMFSNSKECTQILEMFKPAHDELLQHIRERFERDAGFGKSAQAERAVVYGVLTNHPLWMSKGAPADKDWMARNNLALTHLLLNLLRDRNRDRWRMAFP